MAKFIKLTQGSDKHTLVVNVKSIQTIHRHPRGGSILNFGEPEDYWLVNESINEILEMINDD